MKKARFVRIRLDYILDVGREFDASHLPHEVMALTQPGAMSQLIVHGLGVGRRKRTSLRLATAVRFKVSVHKGDLRALKKLTKMALPKRAKARTKKRSKK